MIYVTTGTKLVC